jgi:3-deoxy-D-manno-octulosonate 8-phosphate phosphatase KdsC-like HAD superfamily phosphatase
LPAAAAGIELAAICFMGDDINDLPAMKISPASPRPRQRHAFRHRAGRFCVEKPGGNGAVRELIDAFLHARGLSALEVLSRS